MASTRLDVLKSMLEQNPHDAFSRYGLAMEYRNSGNPDAAAAEFQALVAARPDYVPAYYHYGQTLESMGRADDAREVYRQGIEVAGKKGDRHAQSELQGALDLLG